MKLDPIIQELRLNVPSLEKRVYGIAEYAAVDESMRMDLPAAFVIPISEDPEELLLQTRYCQDVVFNFHVVVLVAIEDDEQGKGSWDKFLGIKKEIFAAILGYDSLDKSDWIEYVGLSILGLNRAFLALQMEFKSWYRIEENETRHGGDIERLGRFKRIFGDVDLAKPDGAIDAKFKVELTNGD